MEEIIVKRFKPYRKMRWYRSNYLWTPDQNSFLDKYRIKVVNGLTDPQDVLAIPCPHVPGHEAMIHRDDTLWITHGHRGEMDFQIAARVVEVAEKLGHTPAQIAVAWLLSKEEVTAPVVGVSKISQLDQLVAATEITLEEDDITYLEELYRPVENLLSLGSS